ncbi:CDP-alcohol phosphatidyltransferase family protein [Arthrobacter sp. I2-34]|uniref:CDP-alcohol phosphatidyltransferase family protein n=1 Tax=Arthrobacter hankyongi TaxID=2904801 RepID=A0ABS9L1N7_9MICC|nr:CDP-alcohol phosphatidyltransferase family protein [Arthrobacter hankyongi]MCG2620541.1 CDP-alcohol phosphatidyltransferase family protein [Arthrobacter hankyongi]
MLGRSEVRPGYRETVRALAGAQKAATPGTPAYSVLVNRRAGRLLAAGAYRAGLTPNMVSTISAAFTFSAITLLAAAPAGDSGPAGWTGPVVWAGLAIGYAFDSADGQVARLRGGGSLCGEWLDHVLDSIKASALHLAVLVCAYRTFGLDDPVWLLVPVAYCLVDAVAFLAMILTEQLRKNHFLKAGAAIPRRIGSRLKSLALLPTDYGFLCFVFLFIGAPLVFMGLYTLFFAANLAYLVLACVKWFREMRRLDPAAAAASEGGRHA